MDAEKEVSTLGYALMGLLRQKPRSGYDLRKMFALTPLGTFSDSPGAIYPALRRLEERKLVVGRIEERGGLRRRKVFRLSSPGNAELKKWLLQPVRREEVVRGMNDLMLRFAFTEESFGNRGPVRFLKSLEKELNSYLPSLHKYLKAEQSNMPLSGRLALESGIGVYKTHLKWTRKALAAYQKETLGRAS